MQILPPDLLFDKRRYFSDLEYRRQYDLEVEAERNERLQILFTNDYDYRYTEQCYESQHNLPLFSEYNREPAGYG